MKLVKSPTNIIQQVIRPGQKGVNIEIPLKSGLKNDNIDHVEPACNCTAKVGWSKEAITASYDDNTSKASVEEYPLGVKTVRKHLTVYHKDGKPLKVKKLGKGMIWNPKKSKEHVFFEVTVALNPESFKQD